MSNTEPSTTNEEQPTTSVSEQSKTPLKADEQLKEAIRNQIEFYFSSENLPTDTFLLSNMDENQYVTVSLIASFGKIQALTHDQDIIVQSLEESKFIEVSEDKKKIRLRENKRRNRIILHNLPPETTDQEISALFATGNFTPEIKADVNNCWFISFDTEDDAIAALEFIRKQKIHDKSIRARLKPETTLRAIYTQPTTQFVPGGTQFNYSGAPYNLAWNPMAPVYWDANGDMQYRNYDGKEGYRKPYKKGQRKDSARGGKGYDGKKRSSQNRKNKGRDKKQAPVQLGPSDFPSLPSVTSSKNTGYSKEFIKYNQDELATSLRKLKPQRDAELQDEFPVLSSMIMELEVDNIISIESSDLPPRTTTLPLSERVKKSTPPAPAKQTKTSKGKKAEKTKAEKPAKQKANEFKPKPAKNTQSEKGSTWSQVAKAGDKKQGKKKAANEQAKNLNPNAEQAKPNQRANAKN